jgi:hypothetical protein
MIPRYSVVPSFDHVAISRIVCVSASAFAQNAIVHGSVDARVLNIFVVAVHREDAAGFRAASAGIIAQHSAAIAQRMSSVRRIIFG